jgi:predicted nucleic acid-binding protein
MATSGRPEPPKVFIDSSVLIAAAISGTGSARDLIVAGLRGDFTLQISRLVLEETERNLAEKAPAALPLFIQFRGFLSGTLADPSDQLVIQVARVIAAKDAPIVAAAVSAGSAYLATYDRKHLLRQKEQIEALYGISVVTPDVVVRSHPSR